MVGVKIINILLCIACSLVTSGVCNSDVLEPTSSKSTVVEIKSSQEDVNTLDIHLAMKSGNGLSNLKDIVRDEVTSQLKDFLKSSNIDNRDKKRPTIVHSTNDSDPDYIFDLENICLKQVKSVGVQYNKKFKNQTIYPRNCKEVQQNGNNVSGIYEIFPRYSPGPFPVVCDMETKGGGWTHIQKRFDGSQDFTLGWKDYKFGFGDLEGEFWLGLQRVYLLTGFESMELLVEIVDRADIPAYAQYSSFAIGPESGGYKMERLSGFTGDAGDSLTYHLSEKFSTKDLDFTAKNCATTYHGGWWYKDCHISNLNGKYINIDLPKKFIYQGLHWKSYRGYEYSHSKSRMLVRPSLPVKR